MSDGYFAERPMREDPDLSPDDYLNAARINNTQLAQRCNDCGLSVDPDFSAPSCGAHLLHIECATYFTCRECRLIRDELTRW